MNQHDPTPAIRPDPRLAARMMRAYNDQLNQVITYTYQHLLTEGLDTEASNLFLRLSREDMTHFHTLGRLIRALGGDPGVTLRMRTPRLGNTTSFTCNNVCLTNIVEQRGLTMVYVTHHRYDRSTREKILLTVGLL